MNRLNGHFPTILPILNGKNYDNWCKQMKFVLCYQDVCDLVKNEVTLIDENVTHEQKVVHKDFRKKDYKALLLIHKCVDPNKFEKVGDVD